MYIGQESFFPQTAREAAKDLFKRNVQRVEIETHSYCNRRCANCPNVVGDRLGDNKQMPEGVWSLVLGNLQEIDFNGNVVLNSYNEPLADKTILKRIHETREMVPKARTMIYTNGDYLTPAYMKELADAGLKYMHVSIHMGTDDKYSDIYALDRISEITTRIGIAAKFKTIRSKERRRRTSPSTSKSVRSTIGSTAPTAAACSRASRSRADVRCPAISRSATSTSASKAPWCRAAISAATTRSTSPIATATCATTARSFRSTRGGSPPNCAAT
jgi:Radical SAM superfamily